MDVKSREFELSWLKYVLKKVKTARTDVEARKAVLDEQVDEWLKAYNDENVELFMQLVVGTDMQEGLAKLLRVYRNAESSPYFGRVDFAERGDEERRVYIGRGGITTPDNEMLVIDWRTPVANLYYDAQPGPASYESPDGLIEGEMSLKRTYNIKDGALLDFYDADVITNDELLQEYLAKNADVVLRDIVATIQSDQNEIIRAEPWRNVIVQGVAGSGKTTVALHRLSYLIFNTEAKENRYCIIGTNRMFLNYISGMLPDLGVDSIRQTVLRELLLHILFYNPDAKAAEPPPEKASQAFAGALCDFMRAFEERIFLTEDVTLAGETLVSCAEVAENFALRPRVPMRERAENFTSLIEHRVKTRLDAILAHVEDGYDRRVRETDDREEKNRLLDEKYVRLKQVRAESKTVRRAFLNRLKKCSETKLYLEFLGEYAKRSDAALDLAADAARGVKRKTYDLYDLCALAYISCRLDPNERTKAFDHIVIDEAQDFGPTVFLTLTECFPQARFTILGDIAQNIHGERGLASWDDIAPLFPSLFFRALTKSYRNTIEIAEFANRVLEKIGTGYEITPVVRHGRGVAFERAADFADCVARAERAIRDTTRPGGSAAVICRDAAEAEAVYEALSQHMAVSLIRDDTDLYEGGVVVTPVAAVKGLEFDTVVVFDASAAAWPDDPATAKRLYVALTRALHELNIFYQDAPSALLL